MRHEIIMEAAPLIMVLRFEYGWMELRSFSRDLPDVLWQVTDVLLSIELAAVQHGSFYASGKP